MEDTLIEENAALNDTQTAASAIQFTIERDQLLPVLQALNSVVEKRHTMAILANICMRLTENELTLSATDLELELIARLPVVSATQLGAITLPARKLFDICRSLPEGSMLSFEQSGARMHINTGASRFVLSTLAAETFPCIEGEFGEHPLPIQQKSLLNLFKKTSFAMAQQDVRYFLNGMLFEFNQDIFRVVATDGHRLAMQTIALPGQAEPRQMIVPRKAIVELTRLLEESETPAQLCFGKNHLRIQLPNITFTTKLLEGKYPDYNRVIPAQGPNMMAADRDALKEVFARVAILSNEQYRGIRCAFGKDRLEITATNPEQEQASDELAIQFTGNDVEIGFNVNYLLDVLNVLPSGIVTMTMSSSTASALMRSDDDQDSVYVIMPIRL